MIPLKNQILLHVSRRSLLQRNTGLISPTRSILLTKCVGTRSLVSDTKQRSAVIGKLDLEEICRTGNVPVNFNFAKDIFDWHAAQRPKDPALWFCNERGEDRIWSFSDVQRESVRASLALQKILKEDTPEGKTPKFILTILSRIPEWWFLHMGAIRTGTIFCPGTTLLTTDDIQYRLEASSAHIVITDETNADKVDQAYHNLRKSSGDASCKNLKKLVITNSRNSTSVSGDWINYGQLINSTTDSEITNFQDAITKSDEIAQAFFTSGTTGKPKMVAHSHSSYGIGHYETVRVVDLQPKDVFWNISDPGWAKSSYSTFFAPWIAGCTVFIHQMKRFEAKPVLEVLKSKPVTALCAPPTLFKTMVAESSQYFQFKALRYAVGGGEPLNPEVMRDWKNKTGGIPIGQIYGQTESTAVQCEIPGKDKEGSLGKPNGMYTAIIVDEGGNEVPRNEEGILALKLKPVHPVGLFKGYLKQINMDGPVWDKEKNDQCFVGDSYLTGDKCYMDEDGYIFFIGRADDIINSSGSYSKQVVLHNNMLWWQDRDGIITDRRLYFPSPQANPVNRYRIGPTEVESALQTHPAVVESAAVSSPDKKRGEIVTAYIVLHDNYKESNKSDLITEIQNHVKSQTAPYKYPRKIEFVDSLPKTVSGKILRRELKRQEYEKQQAN